MLRFATDSKASTGQLAGSEDEIQIWLLRKALHSGQTITFQVSALLSSTDNATIWRLIELNGE